MSGASRDRGSLLVVASSQDACRPLVDTLAQLGYSVLVAEPRRGKRSRAAGSADLALRFVSRGEVVEPGGFGWARERVPSVPIGAIVEGGDPSVGLSALAEGAQFWLPHPVEPSVLAGALDAAIGRMRERDDLAREAQHARELIESVPVGVFEIADGRIVYVNEYLVRVSKYSREEFAGMLAEELVVPEDRERARKALADRRHGDDSGPSTYRLVGKDGVEHTVEISTRRLAGSDGTCIEGTIRDITQETRLRRLHRVVLELGEVILGEQNIDRMLQLVLDTIVEYSGFRRAVATLYDLSVPVPFEGSAYKTLSSGLSPEEKKALSEQTPMPVAERRQVFDERFRLGPAYYIPHDKVPWGRDVGLRGTVTIEGWHQDDYLFIPLRGTAGIIGSISVDDPIDQSVPTVTSIEPVASLANLAALAVERVYKLTQLRKQKDRLRSLSQFGEELAHVQDLASLCDAAARRIRDDLEHDYCGIWMRDEEEIVLEGTASDGLFPKDEVPPRGARVPLGGHGLTRWAIQYVEPVIVQDVSQDPRYLISRAAVRSMTAVPIIGKKKVLGSIDVESRTLAAFGEQDLEVLTAIAGQLAITIASLNRRDSLSRIYGLGQRIAAATTIDQVVTSTLDFLVEHFDYRLASIFLQDRNEQLTIAGVRGPYEEVGIISGWSLPEGKGIVSWVARNRRSALVSDVQSDPRYLTGLPSTRSELAVPLLFAERLVGVLNVESSELGSFDEEDRQLLEVTANHLSTAISNLSAKETLREQAVRDPLTGLFNRHYFNSMIAPELSRSDRYAHPFSVMIDVDGFRAVNNRFGHLRGDEVLQGVAQLLNENVRTSDRVIRYGGDEFLVFMPETEVADAETVSVRLRDRIRLVPRRTGVEGLDIGLSIGIYTRQPREARSLEWVLAEVDRRMYADKRARHVDRADDYRS